MQNVYPKIRIEMPTELPSPNGTKIFVDDIEQLAVRKATLIVEVGKPVTLTLEQFVTATCEGGANIEREVVVTNTTALEDKEYEQFRPAVR